MGVMSQFFQPPLYWQQFEDFTARMLGEVYTSLDTQQYGRPGQAQNGVDVYGSSSRGWIGIQCKRLSDLDGSGNPYPGGPISRKFLRAAAKDSLRFTPDLDIWILVTTARRDTRVQDHVNELNQEWRTKGYTKTALVWSWDECISYQNSYPDLQQWYYQDVIKVRGSEDLDKIILELVTMAFARPAFEVPLHCETSDEFLQALKDTQKALRTGELVDRESRHVIRKAIGGYRDLADDFARERLGRIDKILQRFRTEIEEGLRNGTIRKNQGYLDFTDIAAARDLEDMRSKCVQDLNEVLSRFHLPTI
jgi:hypothetical protein